MNILIIIFNVILSFIYTFTKLMPVNEDKILFCSRQSDEIPLDFAMLRNRIEEKNPEKKFVFICQRIHSGFRGHAAFAMTMLKSMYHLATSRVCIIDSYWPAVSLLNHRKSLKVIQLWHSIGKTKKSGYQTLDKKSGRNGNLAKSLKMHNNYDYVVGGAEVWNPYYSEAFNIPEDRVLNCGLPRIDYLLNTEEANRIKFFEEYPELKGRKIVLYAPTFRRNMKSGWHELVEAKNLDDLVIIMKNHPGQVSFPDFDHRNIVSCDNWKTLDLLSICDYLITDYSSIALEAAVLNKKTFYWVYDYDEYMKNSGINIELRKELPGNVYENIENLINSIKADCFDATQYESYRKKYLPRELGNSTEYLSEFIIGLSEKRDYDEVRQCG